MQRKVTDKVIEGHKKRVQKLKASDPDFFHDIGSIGGNLTTTKYTSESGRRASNIRWERYRREQLRKAKGDTDETENV